MVSSNFLAESSEVTFARYIYATERMIKNEGNLLLPVSLAMDASMVKTFGTTHIDDKGFHISTDEESLLMLQASNALVKTDHKPAPFDTYVFAAMTALCLTSFTIVTWSRQGIRSQHLPFSKNIKHTRNITRTIVFLLTISMRLLDYVAWGHTKKWKERVENCKKRLIRSRNTHFNPANKASYSKHVFGEIAMRDSFQKKPSQKTRSSDAKDIVKAIALYNFELKVGTPRKVAEMY